jgi:hypothetical protein
MKTETKKRYMKPGIEYEVVREPKAEMYGLGSRNVFVYGVAKRYKTGSKTAAVMMNIGDEDGGDVLFKMGCFLNSDLKTGLLRAARMDRAAA